MTKVSETVQTRSLVVKCGIAECGMQTCQPLRFWRIFFYAFLKLKLGYSGVYGTARYKRRILGLRLLNVSLSCQDRRLIVFIISTN